MSVVLPIRPDERWRRYTASSGQTAFSIDFPFQQSEDVAVLSFNSGKYSEINQSLYFISGAGDPQGGTVNFHVGRTNGDVIGILGRAILDRMSSVVRDGRFSSKLIDDELDRNRIIQQEQARDIERSIKAPYGSANVELLAPNGSNLLYVDAAGNIVESETPPNEKTLRVEGDALEASERRSADEAERTVRLSADANLQAQIDSINLELDDFASSVARAEAAADTAEAAAASAQELVQEATAGFQGFEEGNGYDFGFIFQTTTYFDQDFGSITEPVTN